jgi:putative transposase
VRELIARMCRDNPLWSSERIRGELLKPGIATSKCSIHRCRGQPPRRPSQTWGTFLRAHARTTWAADRFTVQTLALRTLYVLLLITHGRRELVHVGVTAHPRAAWVWRQLVEATAWGRRPWQVVRDRDAVYDGEYAARAQGLGIETVLTPARASRANAVAERVVRTLRNVCLDHLIPLHEAHLRAVLAEYVPDDNAERPPTGACSSNRRCRGPDRARTRPGPVGARLSAPRVPACRLIVRGLPPPYALRAGVRRRTGCRA